MKADNQRLLLRLLHEKGTLSRKELSVRSGLTPAAVSKLTASLIADGYVKECGVSESHIGAGRKEVRLQTTLEDILLLGVYVELNAVTFSVSTMEGKAIDQVQRSFSGEYDAVVSQTMEFLEERRDLRPKIRHIGVCVLGDGNENCIGPMGAAALQSAFESRFGLPTAVENNVKAFVLAERCFGHKLLSNRTLFFKWGPGVGSALYAGGSVVSGDAGNVAEIGHYIVDPGGKKCRCGRYGCLETVCAQSVLLEESHEKTLEKLLESDAPETKNLLDQKINTVSIALTNTSTIFSTKHIVLFGSMFRYPAIVEKLKKQMLRYNQNLAEEKIVLSGLNDRIGVVSPAAVCAERFFFSLQEE